MLPGFSATTDGFEARIKLLETQAGRWSAPQKWTPYQRYLNSTPPAGSASTDITGLVGIHTHVLPNGKVLSWEGHNDNTLADPTKHDSHAYAWDPVQVHTSTTTTRTAIYFAVVILFWPMAAC